MPPVRRCVISQHQPDRLSWRRPSAMRTPISRDRSDTTSMGRVYNPSDASVIAAAAGSVDGIQPWLIERARDDLLESPHPVIARLGSTRCERSLTAGIVRQRRLGADDMPGSGHDPAELQPHVGGRRCPRAVFDQVADDPDNSSGTGTASKVK